MVFFFSTPHCSVRLNFQSMSGSIQLPSGDSTIEFHLRRLESSARKSAGDGEWFEAQWMWYKLDDTHKWIRYEANLVSSQQVVSDTS